MHCTTCDRSSNNRRVCPHCFTPYPVDDGSPSLRRNPTPLSQPAQGSASVAGGSARNAQPSGLAALSPTLRWTSLGIVFVLVAWMFLPSAQADLASATARGAAPAIEPPTMTRVEAEAFLRQSRESALVESQADEVFVSYRAATFPLREDGQLALVKRYAEADEVVEGRRRRIVFYNPNGRIFAQSDPAKGIVVP